MKMRLDITQMLSVVIQAIINPYVEKFVSRLTRQFWKRALLYLQKQQSKGALGDLNQLLMLNPTFIPVCTTRGDMALTRHRLCCAGPPFYGISTALTTHEMM